MAGIISCVFGLLTRFAILPDPITAGRYLFIAATLLFVGTVWGCLNAFRENHNMMMITFFTSCCFLLSALAAIPYIETRTIAPLAVLLKPLLTPEDEIIAYNQYYQDLPFYLGRHISVLNWRNELSYGIAHQDNHEWMIDDAQFWQKWHSHLRIFVIMALPEYENFQARHPNVKTYLLGKTIRYALITNHPQPNPLDMLSH
jgi:hypothetical protein